MINIRAEIFLGRNNLYYFRFVANNGQILATSGDGYTTYYNCEHALNIVKNYAHSCITIRK